MFLKETFTMEKDDSKLLSFYLSFCVSQIAKASNSQGLEWVERKVGDRKLHSK